MADVPRLVLSELTLSAIQAEATRAHLKHAEHSMLSEAYTEHERLAILLEEGGEAAVEAQRLLFQNLALLASVPSDLLRTIGQVAHRLTYDQPDDKTELVRELIQVAAMAGTWVQYLEGSHDHDRVTLPRCPCCGMYFRPEFEAEKAVPEHTRFSTVLYQGERVLVQCPGSQGPWLAPGAPPLAGLRPAPGEGRGT